MIDLRTVRYIPEVRIESALISSIGAKSTEKVEELPNIQGIFPNGAVALVGLQATPNSSVVLRISTDAELVNEFNTAGLAGTALEDSPIYFEARRSVIIDANNISTSAVTNFGARYTWVAWRPDDLLKLLQTQLRIQEKYPIYLPPEALNVIERGFITVRRKVFTFYGDVTAVPQMLCDVFTAKPGELIVLEKIAGDINANVVLSVFREGAKSPDMNFSAAFFPANKIPLSLWMPASSELMVTLSATTTVTGYSANAVVRYVKPVSPEYAIKVI